MKLNEAWENVKDFHRIFGHPISEAPCLINEDRAKKRYNWMLEEINEFIESKTIVDQADAMIDLIYFALGTLVEMGLKPEALFKIVHNANLQKVWPDGSVQYNSEGKTKKPPHWQDPYPLLEQEIKNAVKESFANSSE